MKTIKVTITEEDKIELEKLAKKVKKPLARFIREQLEGIVTNNSPEYDTVSRDTEINDNGPRSHELKVMITEKEYELLKESAGDSTVSAYVRRVLKEGIGGRFVFEIKTDDLEELNNTISEMCMHVDGFIGALRYRNDVYQADIERLEKLLTETTEAVASVDREIRANRKDIKNKGRRYLEQRIRKIVRGN